VPAEVKLTKTEIKVLKELTAAGGHGRTIAGVSSAEIAHLMRAQFIKRLPGMKLYRITARGRQLLAEAAAVQR